MLPTPSGDWHYQVLYKILQPLQDNLPELLVLGIILIDEGLEVRVLEFEVCRGTWLIVPRVEVPMRI